ncbi:MAG: excalibur calcium-binding domain-containing protein [SAR324 cluster bacterium]|nr:excalibur calcium-binding domain-containing protein [SAR324 cluster bacterium]
MKNYEETRAYLTQCNIQILDRDGDGVPCVTLCD